MTERRLTFIDVDENPLVVCLKEDRVQLLVVDSRPELEARELRAFAAALFAAYGGAPLASQLVAARETIAEVRDQLALAGGAESLLAALDRSLCAISDVTHRMTAAAATIAAEPVDRPRSPRRGKRAGEGGGVPAWGWTRQGDALAAGG